MECSTWRGGGGAFVEREVSSPLCRPLGFSDFRIAADVDGDGDVDLASERVLYLNDGSGHFASASASIPTLPCYRVDAVGDVDGNGAPDLLQPAGWQLNLIRNDGSHALETEALHVRKYRNYGDGTSWTSTETAIWTPLGYQSALQYVVLANDGAGRFEARSVLSVSQRDFLLASGDVTVTGTSTSSARTGSADPPSRCISTMASGRSSSRVRRRWRTAPGSSRGRSCRATSTWTAMWTSCSCRRTTPSSSTTVGDSSRRHPGASRAVRTSWTSCPVCSSTWMETATRTSWPRRARAALGSASSGSTTATGASGTSRSAGPSARPNESVRSPRMTSIRTATWTSSARRSALWLNDGTGRLAPARHRLPGEPYSHRVYAADFDLDGDRDLIAGQTLFTNIERQIAQRALPASGGR